MARDRPRIIRVFARAPTCIYVARGLVLVRAEGSTKSLFEKFEIKSHGAWKVEIIAPRTPTREGPKRCGGRADVRWKK